jgi:hypothetical protein
MDLAESTLLAAALHAGLLLVSARWIPAIGDVEEDRIQVALTYPLIHLEPIQFHQPGEIEDMPPAILRAERDPDGRERVDSRCGGHLGGSMGEPTAADEERRYGVQGTKDNPDPHIARVPSYWETREMDMIGLTPEESMGGDPAAPMEPWGREDSFGNDPASARGHMWGEDPGVARGSPGAGIGLRRICTTCGDDGRGAPPAPVDGLEEGGATGTERAGRAR